MSSRQIYTSINISDTLGTSETKCRNILNWDIKIIETYECIFLLQNFHNTFAY